MVEILSQQNLIPSSIFILVRHQHTPCSLITTPSLNGIAPEFLGTHLGQHLVVDDLYISLSNGGRQVPYDFAAAARSDTVGAMLDFVKDCIKYEAVKGRVRSRMEAELEQKARELNLLQPVEKLPAKFKLCCSIRPEILHGSVKEALTRPDGSPLTIECDGHELRHILALIEDRQDKSDIPHFEFAVNYEVKKGAILRCNYCGRTMTVYDHHFRRLKELKVETGCKHDVCLRLPRAVCEGVDKDHHAADGGPLYLCQECKNRKQERLTHLLLPSRVLPFLLYASDVVSNVLDWLNGRFHKRIEEKYRYGNTSCLWMLMEVCRSCGRCWERHRQVVLDCLKPSFNVGMAWRIWNKIKINGQSGSRPRDCAEDSCTADRYEGQTIRRLYAVLLTDFIILFSTYYLYPLSKRPHKLCG